MTAAPALPFAWGGPVGTARVAALPEDFRVDEQLGFVAAGEGPHLLVRIRKRALSTMQAIHDLADHWQVARRGVGHAGRKDRMAVTTQWLSVPWPIKAPCPDAGPVPAGGAGELEVLSVARHRRKLPVGALTGNRFTLTLRSVDAPRALMIERLLAIARLGVPNYFGGQRFGRDHRNLERAGEWLMGGAPPRSRNDRSMLISAARSAMFNAVLASRVRAGCWQWPQPDDLLTLDDRGSLFPAEPTEASFNRRRAAGLRIHPTGPLPGRDNRRQPLPEGLGRRERDCLVDWQGWIDALADRAVVADRRALRLSIRGLAIRQLDATTWRLAFGLTRGAYATTVLRELITQAAGASAAE